jgi:hypothetical protein
MADSCEHCKESSDSTKRAEHRDCVSNYWLVKNGRSLELFIQELDTQRWSVRCLNPSGHITLEIEPKTFRIQRKNYSH